MDAPGILIELCGMFVTACTKVNKKWIEKKMQAIWCSDFAISSVLGPFCM